MCDLLVGFDSSPSMGTATRLYSEHRTWIVKRSKKVYAGSGTSTWLHNNVGRHCTMGLEGGPYDIGQSNNQIPIKNRVEQLQNLVILVSIFRDKSHMLGTDL